MAKPRGRQPKNGKAAKQVFAGCTFVLTGDFGGPVRSHTNITRWINTHGGIVETKVTHMTTHLISSLENYEKKVPEVRDAMKLTTKKCKIVTWDWLEDCLVRTGKGGPKLLNGKGKVHSCRAALAEVRRQKKEMVRRKEKFEDDGKMAKELVDPQLYHIYRDFETGFEFKVILTRVTIIPKVLVEKYTLFLFESHAIPRVYMTGAKFNCGSRPTAFFRENLTPKEFYDAFKDFKKFFHKKTGVQWEERFDLKQYTQDETWRGNNEAETGTEGRPEVGGFRWLPPGMTVPTAKQILDKGKDKGVEESERAGVDKGKGKNKAVDVEMKDRERSKHQQPQSQKARHFLVGPQDRLDPKLGYDIAPGSHIARRRDSHTTNTDSNIDQDDNESGSEESTEFYSATSNSALSARRSESGDEESESEEGSDMEEEDGDNSTVVGAAGHDNDRDGDEESDTNTDTDTETEMSIDHNSSQERNQFQHHAHPQHSTFIPSRQSYLQQSRQSYLQQYTRGNLGLDIVTLNKSERNMVPASTTTAATSPHQPHPHPHHTQPPNQLQVQNQNENENQSSNITTAAAKEEEEVENPYKSYAGFEMTRPGRYRWVW